MAFVLLALALISAAKGGEDVISGKGSWYSQFNGKHVWIDRQDRPGSAALGVADHEQGIAFYNRATLGQWFEVRAPNGNISIEQQTDVGPHPRTGRLIDISAAAAERMGYSPSDFPTNAKFEWRPIPVPNAVNSFPQQEQATKFLQLRGMIANVDPDPIMPP